MVAGSTKQPSLSLANQRLPPCRSVQSLDRSAPKRGFSEQGPGGSGPWRTGCGGSIRPQHPATVQNLDSDLRIGWRVDKPALTTTPKAGSAWGGGPKMSHQSPALSRARMMLESQGRFPGGALPGDNSDSWLRSLGLGLDPLARSEDLVLTDTAFRASRADHADLIHFARPELELLFDQIAGSNFMIALGSPDGV
eukprot:gene29603-51626_t